MALLSINIMQLSFENALDPGQIRRKERERSVNPIRQIPSHPLLLPEVCQLNQGHGYLQI